MGIIRMFASGLRSCAELARKIGKGKWDRISVFFDIIYCRLRFHTNSDEYKNYKLYNFKDRYRKNFLLVYHQKNGYKYFNERGMTRSKYGFYSRMADCFSREMILAPECGEEAFLEFAKKHGKIVTKPDSGSYGRNIEIFSYLDEDQARKYYSDLSGDTICEQFICQHETLNELNPYSVNTIRIVTLLEKDGVSVVSATLKTGSRPDTFVDNMHKNGIGANVDVSTGVVCTHGFDYDDGVYVFHPLTGVRYLGLNIPNWSEAVELVKRAHSKVPQCRLLGWDVAITPSGADIVEANNAPGPLLMQIGDLVPKGENVIHAIKEAKKLKSRNKG